MNFNQRRNRTLGTRSPRSGRRFATGVERLEGRRLLSSVAFAQTLGTANNAATAEAASTDSAGNTYITGGFRGTVSFGSTTLTSAGAADIYVAKLDPTGSFVWARRMGSPVQSDSDFGRSVRVDGSGNIYLAGFFYGTADFGGVSLTAVGDRDGFAAKLDGNGNVIWARDLGGGSSDLAQGIAFDSGSNVFVTGTFQGSVNVAGIALTSTGSADGYLAKLDPNGNALWAQRLGGFSSDSSLSVGVDSDNNSYVAGVYSQTAAFGSLSLTSRGDTDGFVAKFDPSGNALWARSIGGAGTDEAVGMAVGTGGVYLTGIYTGNASFGPQTMTSVGRTDAFVTRLDKAGNFVWTKSFGGAGDDSGVGIATDDSDNAYVTGAFQGSATFAGVILNSYGGNDVFGMRLDGLGRIVFVQGIGSAGDDTSYNITAGGPSTNVTLVGIYSGTAQVSNVTLPATSNAYVVQLSQYTTPTGVRPPSNFDNLGRTQPAVFRPSTGQWFAQAANGAGESLGVFGDRNYVDIPVAGDYAGTGRSQLAVARPSTAQWFGQDANGAGKYLGNFGETRLVDIPLTGDFLDLGYDQKAVFRPSTAQWFVEGPNGGQLLATFGDRNLIDIPVPGDYDGTGRTQLAVFRPSTAQWFILRPNGGQLLANFGERKFVDIPVPGDYDGNGHVQPAVFRPSTGQWFVLRPSGGALLTTFGDRNFIDVPTQAPVGALLALGRLGNGARPFALTAGTALNASLTSPAKAQTAGFARASTSIAATTPTAGSITAKSVTATHGESPLSPSLAPETRQALTGSVSLWTDATSPARRWGRFGRLI